MTDKQIEQLLARARRSAWVRNLSQPFVGWGVTAASIGALWAVDLSIVALTTGVVMGLLSVQVSRRSLKNGRQLKRLPTQQMWHEITGNTRVFPSPSVDTLKLKRALHSLYDDDGRDEVLPLVQAARLLVIYDLQQQRRSELLSRLTELRHVRNQLENKVARLDQLGESTALVETSVRELEEEIAGIERVSDDILASCQRLEGIVSSVMRVVQVKQLHREIAALKSSVSPGRIESTQLVTPEIMDVERQIGREIETFLQLERETDERLREV